MTTATKRRKLEQAEAALQVQWQAAWVKWGRQGMREWQRVEPEWKREHDALFQPLYQEWAASVRTGDEAAFLARGDVLAKWWESAPSLWAWQWQALHVWLEQDLRRWPHQLTEPPEMPDGALQQLVREAVTAEDYALILAVCTARVESVGQGEAAPRPGRDGGAAGS